MDPSQGANPPSRFAVDATRPVSRPGGVGRSTPAIVAIVGVLAAFAAQLAMRQVGWELGLAMSIRATVAFVAAVRGRQAPAAAAAAATDDVALIPRGDRSRILTGFVVVALITIALYAWVDPLHLTRSVWLLHATAIIGIVIAAVLADRAGRTPERVASSPTDNTPIAVWVMLGVLVAAGAWLRLRNLDGLPFGFWFDEADAGLVARRILDDPSFRPVFVFPGPVYHSYLISVVFAVFGESVTAVRAVSAAFGVGTILAGYLTGRELLGRRGGLVLAFLVTFSRWDLTLSRIGMNNVTVPFFSLMTLGLVLRGYRRRSTLDFVLAGLFAGTGVLFYTAMLSSVVALALVAGALALGSRARLRWALPRLAAAALGAVIVCTPLARFAIDDPDAYLARNRQTAIWSPTANIEDGQELQAVADNAVRYLAMTHYQGDRNGRHNLPGEPMLAPLVAGLALVGLGVAAAGVARALGLVTVVWLPLALLPGVLTLPWEAPNSIRAVAVLPVALLLATAAVTATARVAAAAPNTRRLFVALAAVGLGATALFEVQTYFGRQADDFAVWAGHSTNDTIAADLTAQSPAGVYVGAVAFLRNRPTIDFLTEDRRIDGFFRTDAQLPWAIPPGRDALLLTTPEAYDLVDQAIAFYPNATIERYPPEPAELIAIRVPAGDLEASVGWTSVVEGDIRISTATLVTDSFGQYRFRVGPSDQLSIDGSVVCSADDVVGLFSGVHRVVVTSSAHADSGPAPLLEWIPPDTDSWHPVPAHQLLAGRFSAAGLRGVWHTDPDDLSSDVFGRIDANIDLRFHEFPIGRPYRADWTGTLNVPDAGEYEFTIVTDGDALLRIDDTQVVVLAAREGQASGQVTLDRGPVAIAVSLVDRDGTGHMRLRWKRPGVDSDEIVPSSVLSPAGEAGASSACAG